MVSSDYFVYKSANLNPRIKEPQFLDATQGGLLKNVQSHFAKHRASQENTLFSETPCIII